MATFSASWTSDELAHAVCDALVADGRIKVKPEFIRKDREAKIAKVFGAAGLDGAKMQASNARGIEVLIRNATQGEAWVDDVQNATRAMLSEEAAKDRTGPAESSEMKSLREKMYESARTDNPDGSAPVARGRRDEGGEGGGFGGGNKDCFNWRAARPAPPPAPEMPSLLPPILCATHLPVPAQRQTRPHLA